MAGKPVKYTQTDRGIDIVIPRAERQAPITTVVLTLERAPSKPLEK